MKIGLTVKFITGESADVDAVFPDFIAFEKPRPEGRGKSVYALTSADTALLTDLAFLAWTCEKRRGRTTLGFDAWNSTVDEIGVRGEAVPAPLDG
jgi:hypothetical protein